MLADELTIYESWNLEQPSIPLRSRLYQLEPVGIGTPLVESLTGYVVVPEKQEFKRSPEPGLEEQLRRNGKVYAN